ncbi:MAG: glutamate--tRNA ligase [Candidatus Moranbacteria bacterium CG_4_9_14_3_um_filter_42_9]|nr:MAG: glutamate--tRNA ligase [Candidatus Moranbacteria bacterium CG_4_9_14_3_um_filter_42_9]
MNKIRVRIAPSPTGYVHIGNFRTMLYNYLFAQKNGADFVVRIEDTDRKRFVEGSLEGLLKVLDWAGFKYAEGPCLEKRAGSFESKNYTGVFEAGVFQPYIQSERLELYQKYARELVASGHAYYCFCEPERLGKLKEEQRAKKQAPMYDRFCLQNVSEGEINKNLKSNCPFTIRLKIPTDEKIEFADLVRGKVSIETSNIDDQVLLKSDGFPTYHLANVVDDHLMEITHVIRGEEWLPSTPKHILLYQAFGWEIPKFAHLPLLLNPDRSKLSKRQGDVAVEDYIAKGYLKEAIINFVALLGWNPGEGSTQEIFSLEELIKKFDLEHVHKGGAVFDLQKLDWLNSEYIKKLPLNELYENSMEFFAQKYFYQNASEEKKSEEYLKKVLTIEQDRLKNLSEVGEHNKFFFTDIKYDKELLRWKKITDKELTASLEKSISVLENISDDDWTRENLEKNLLQAAGDKPARNATHSVAGGRGDLLWPLRAALTGEQKSPSPFEVAWVLGRSEALKRLYLAIKKTFDLK